MLTEKLLKIRELLNSPSVGKIPVAREDLEAVVEFAERMQLGGDVSQLLETFDAVANGYQERIRRQLLGMNELITRQRAVENVLKELSKSGEIHPELIKGFGGIISILRNGVPKDVDG